VDARHGVTRATYRGYAVAAFLAECACGSIIRTDSLCAFSALPQAKKRRLRKVSYL
jgi:hypothetical protein